jgi:exopolyphosphatase/guanosine-5'-triphosphate,3'-diphosphate pyrophosphatase
MRVAAIDVGSNSVRLLVGDVLSPAGRPAHVETIARAGEVCRLGRGLDRTGLIEPALAERAGALAAEFARRARSLGAIHIVVGATAAIRRAGNGEEVARIIGARAGLPVRILTGEEEARLVYRSVVLGLGGMASRSSCVAFDLGGGSTEVVSGVGDRAGRWASLPFGAVSLTERHLKSDPPTREEVEALSREVRERLMHDCASMPERTPLLAGVGGTVTVLASMDRGIVSYEPSLLEGWIIPGAKLEQLAERLVTATHAERLEWPIIGEGRADIVAAGAMVVRLLLERFPSQGLVCSTQGLRYGLVRMAAEEVAAGAAPALPEAEA